MREQKVREQVSNVVEQEVITCDRCKSIIKEGSHEKYKFEFRVIVGQFDLTIPEKGMGTEYRLDLCQNCYKEFLEHNKDYGITKASWKPI